MTDDEVITMREYFQDRLQDMDADVQRDLKGLKESLAKLWEIHSFNHANYVTMSMFQNILKERFDMLDRLTKQITDTIDLRFHTIERDTATATVALDHRLEGMNEFRAQITSRDAYLMTKSEYEAKHQELVNRVDTLASSIRDAKEQHYAFHTKTEQEAYEKEVVVRFESTEKSRTDIVARIEALEKYYANLQGRIWALGIGMTVLTIAIATVLHFIPV